MVVISRRHFGNDGIYGFPGWTHLSLSPESSTSARPDPPRARRSRPIHSPRHVQSRVFRPPFRLRASLSLIPPSPSRPPPDIPIRRGPHATTGPAKFTCSPRYDRDVVLSHRTPDAVCVRFVRAHVIPAIRIFVENGCISFYRNARTSRRPTRVLRLLGTVSRRRASTRGCP